MKCPKCENTDLLVKKKHGIEIDICPTCNGIWLDGGELEKILNKIDRKNSLKESIKDDAKKDVAGNATYSGTDSIIDNIFDLFSNIP